MFAALAPWLAAPTATNTKNAKTIILRLMMFSSLTSVSVVLFAAFVSILSAIRGKVSHDA